MIEAPLPQNESERLAALLAYNVLDTAPEQAFDDLTSIASHICGTPIALISLVDGERQWFKSRVNLDATETPRSVAFCSHAILEPDTILLIPDSLKDERFHDNPLAVGQPLVRFYAGAPLVTADGHALGTLCVIDHEPREIDTSQLDALTALSRQVVNQLELRRSNSSLRELSSEVTRKNEELRQFTAIAAHDLSEPARKLISFSDLLKKDLGDDLPPHAGEDLDYIVDAASRMQQLIAALMELSNAGSGELNDEPVALEECARLALDALGPRIQDSGAVVEIEELPMVRGDQVLLTQVFQNLIGNALKFTADGPPQVRVTSATEDGELVVTVADEGIGMEPEHATLIFAPFKRLHGRGTYEGSGIGLAIVNKVIGRHGGRIWVESAPGKGSRFRFTLAKVESRLEAA